MVDFLIISSRTTKNGDLEVYPRFRLYPKSKDLMIRGGDFYAVWIEEIGLWSTDETDALRLIDRELKAYSEEKKKGFDGKVITKYMWDSDSGMIDSWHKYCQKQMRDSYTTLDENLIFSNTETKKESYASKRLPYPLERGSIEAYDKLISTLYSEEERHKIEWAIGAIVSGDSKYIQKFLVLYGAAGTGKSTILNIIQQLFEGYYTVFDAKALGSAGAQFALEAFRTNPLVAIQHDGDLSKIEDNTRLNSVVSHELMLVNQKHKAQYEDRFHCFLFMGTNKPVKITDGKSGIIRRLIDVTPSGNKVSASEYKRIMKQVKFELGAIAQHCLDVYLEQPDKYDNYIPMGMMGATNDFYNFIIDSFHIFKKDDGTTLNAAWEMYKNYCDEAKVPYPFSKRSFKEELRNYFREFNDRVALEDGSRVRSYYSGFRVDIFENDMGVKKEEPKLKLIEFKEQESIFDKEYFDCPAQYATSKETPSKKWVKVKTKLSDLITSKLHYVKVPEKHIVIDFDIKDSSGKKCFEKNLEEASKWPATYAELSKSGGGIHLHYIYTGDVSKLSRIYDDDIEIKVFTGDSSLRRKLSKCNDSPIATINSGLPLKEEGKMVDFEGVKNEKMLRTMIKRNLNKEYCHYTKPSIDFINKLLNEAYEKGLSYDVSDMYNAIFAFAGDSSNNADYCMKIVDKMKLKSDTESISVNNLDDTLVFYDVEVFPNLFLVNWKIRGKDNPVVRLINPTSTQIEDLLKLNLIGFNCRRYDNHMLYARWMGYTNEQLYRLSQKIINSKKGENMDAFFGEAYNISYTDVYDFSSVKQSLKKWEIELGIHHKELGLPWDQPVPEERWLEVAEYCDNDVIATEAVFDARKADFVARQIQVDLVRLLHGGAVSASVNDTTNSLSAKIIFGSNKEPQNEFNYRDLSKPVGSDRYEEYRRKFGDSYPFRVFDRNGLPLYKDYSPGEKLPEGYSILPFFKGYKFEGGVSTFLGEEVSEGGRVYHEPGMYEDVWDGDVSSMHPHSVIFECLFGPKFTKVFSDIVEARVAIKHRDFETAGQLLNGALKPYLNEEQADDLAQALKIIINSIYGLTSAGFKNPFRDIRNKDNIVAKRGALFMTLLKHEVQKRGFTVCHIKTDSIKIPNATPEIMEFVCKFGKEFGYSFETEANFAKFCLVNKAVYIAKHADGKKAGQWSATGKQFAVPYVFKKLFSNEEIVFDDLCESFEVKTALYLDMNEALVNVEDEELVKELRTRPDTIDNPLNKRARDILARWNSVSDQELDDMISEGHDYHFIGKVGRFCPIKPGCGGGELFREAKDKEGNTKYDAATGSSGYRWLESEAVKLLGKEADIDYGYYNKLVDDAVEAISQFGDFEQFIA